MAQPRHPSANPWPASTSSTTIASSQKNATASSGPTSTGFCGGMGTA